MDQAKSHSKAQQVKHIATMIMATSRQRGASTTSTGVLGVVAVVALSAATAAGLYIYRKRRAEAAKSFATSAGGAPDAAAAALTKGGVPIPPGAVPEDAKEVLTQLFAEAADRVKSLPDGAVAPADRLLAYALFKQATAGDRTSSGVTRPSKFNVIAHAKYTAWGKFEGMPKETAMIKYIEASHYLAQDAAKAGVGLAAGKNSGGPIPVENDNADIVYTKEDEYRSSDEDSDADGDGSDLDDVFGSHKNDDAEVKGMGIRQSIMLQTDWEEAESPTDTTCSGDNLQQVSAPATTPRKRALILAAMDGDVSKLRDAIGSGTDIAEADESGQTALHFAADRGSVECVSLLLENGADANSTDREGISVLQAAVIGGDVECVRLLLRAGADPDHEDADGDTARSCANDDGSEEIKAMFADAVIPMRS